MANNPLPKELLKKQVQIRLRPHYKNLVDHLELNLSKFVEQCLVEKYRRDILDITPVEYYQLAHEYKVDLPELVLIPRDKAEAFYRVFVEHASKNIEP